MTEVKKIVSSPSSSITPTATTTTTTPHATTTPTTETTPEATPIMTETTPITPTMQNPTDDEWMDFYDDSGPPHRVPPSSPTTRKDSTTKDSNNTADLLFPEEKDKKIGALYVGSYSAASNVKFIATHNIRAILNCCYVCQPKFPNSLHNKHLLLNDVDDAPLLEYIPDAIEFIASHRSKGDNVLVHCALGKSRSVAVVIAYILSLHAVSEGMKVADALAYVKLKRPIAAPISGFISQLQKFNNE